MDIFILSIYYLHFCAFGQGGGWGFEFCIKKQLVMSKARNVDELKIMSNDRKLSKGHQR